MDDHRTSTKLKTKPSMRRNQQVPPRRRLRPGGHLSKSGTSIMHLHVVIVAKLGMKARWACVPTHIDQQDWKHHACGRRKMTRRDASCAWARNEKKIRRERELTCNSKSRRNITSCCIGNMHHDSCGLLASPHLDLFALGRGQVCVSVNDRRGKRRDNICITL